MKKLKLLITGLVCLFLWSCAAHQPSPASREEALFKRVKAYWDLRIKGASPQERLAFERCGLKPKCREAFLSGGGNSQSLTYYSYEILGVEYPDEKTALVKIKVRYKIPPILGRSFEQESTFKDKWEYIDGQWYHVIKGFSTEW